MLLSPQILAGTSGKTDSAAFRSFIARTSGLSSVYTNAYRTLLNGLTSNGFFDSAGASTKLDFLYIFATSNRTTAVLNLVKNSFNATENSTVSFTAGRGYTGNSGAVFYLDTGFNASTAGGNYVRDSACQGVYVLNNRTVDAAENQIGTTVGSDQNRLIAKNGGNFLYGINSSGIKTVANSTAQGSYVVSRTGSTATTAYKNGASIDTATDASVALHNANMYVFSANLVGTGPVSTTNDEMSAAWVGSGWGSTDALAFQSLINQYMTTLGINVY